MSLRDLQQYLTRGFGGRIEPDFSLARSTTYRLGGPAALYLEPSGRADLEMLLEGASHLEDVPVLIIGRGSNLVVSDDGWPGAVVRLGRGFENISLVTDAEVVVGGATSLPVLANWAARRGLAGVEFAIAVPGSVGGAVRMNAGAHGQEFADRLVSVTVLDLSSGVLGDLPASELGLAYRTSNLTDDQLVVEARLSLEPSTPEVVRSKMEGFRAHRAETQPGAAQNAGSVFKNPPGDHAGRLVEAAELKGFSVGGARVSELHANFFIAGDGATAQDVFDLVAAVRARVAAQSGVDLVPEVRFVGEFSGPSAPSVGSGGRS